MELDARPLFGCLLFRDFVTVDPEDRVVFVVIVFPQLFGRFIGGGLSEVCRSFLRPVPTFK
jgi:hypothetical protein